MIDREPPSAPWQRLPPDEAFNRAATLHQQGRLGEAEQIYRAILQRNPDHFGALHYLGIIAGQHGHAQDAEHLIRRAISLNARSADAHHDLGMTLAKLGRAEEAVAEYQKAVAIDPRHAGARGGLGNTLHALRRSDEAIFHFQQLLAQQPDLAQVHNSLGNALAAVQRGAEAVQSYHGALAIQPNSAEVRNNLGVALASLQRHEEATAQYESAIALRPRYSEAHNNLANTLAALNRHEEAIAHFETALALTPDAAATHNNFGNVLSAMKRRDDAVSHFRKAIEIRPDYFEAHNNLGNALAAEHPAEAIVHYRKAIEINPNFAEAYNNLANVLGALEQYEEATAYYRKALAIDPKMAETHYCLGNALITVGRIDEGREALERAIALAPRRPEFYRILGECKRFTVGDPHLLAMEGLAEESGTFTDDDRILLNFVLAKAYDDIGRPDAAFRHLREANSLRRTQVDYDEANTLGLHERTIRIFTSELMREKAGLGDQSTAPVFVLGMPRSGTTLIEQLLASHPKVYGAGELLALHNAVYGFFSPDGLSRPFPEAATAMTADQFRSLGEHYIRTVTAIAPGAERITDKALGNFVFIGLVRIALPNARIIHARRNPVDTCLSCFSKLFTSELLYTYDLGELGRYYKSYETLMEHWRAVLPQDAMLEVQYEDLVEDFEPHARRIIAYCGLEWDDRCLSFHKTQRPVRTASATQVRQPIYRTAVNRWRPYQNMLQPLLDELRR